MRREIIMQNIRDKMLYKVKEYKENKCNSKGWIKKKNVSAAEDRGLKEIREKVKDKEYVVFKTDKSGKLSADTVQNYEETLQEHVQDDTKISAKKVRDLERKCNSHLKQFNKMFRVGETWRHQKRVSDASTATNVPPPAMQQSSETV